MSSHIHFVKIYAFWISLFMLLYYFFSFRLDNIVVATSNIPPNTPLSTGVFPVLGSFWTCAFLDAAVPF